MSGLPKQEKLMRRDHHAREFNQLYLKLHRSLRHQQRNIGRAPMSAVKYDKYMAVLDLIAELKPRWIEINETRMPYLTNSRRYYYVANPCNMGKYVGQVQATSFLDARQRAWIMINTPIVDLEHIQVWPCEEEKQSMS